MKVHGEIKCHSPENKAKGVVTVLTQTIPLVTGITN